MSGLDRDGEIGGGSSERRAGAGEQMEKRSFFSFSFDDERWTRDGFVRSWILGLRKAL